VILLVVALWRVTMAGEVVFSGYGGKAFTNDNDLDVQSGSTNVRLHDVSWDDYATRDAPYYGFRLGYWFGKTARWGTAIDYTHFKMALKTDRIVRVTGERNGLPVNQREPVRNTIQRFDMSNGVNSLTLNVMHRWFLKGQRDTSLLGRVQPYIGAGGGVIIPFVRADLNGSRTREYQIGGPTAQAFVGLNIDLISHISIFTEGQFSFIKADLDLNGGGHLETEAFTSHSIFGLSVGF
jgi:hypothetical protein